VSRGHISHDRAKSSARFIGLLLETLMTIVLASFIALVSWRAGLALRRLWSALPDRNIDFELVPDDLDRDRRP